MGGTPADRTEAVDRRGLDTHVLGVSDLAAIVATVGLDALVDELIDQLTAALRRHDDQTTVTFDRAGFHYTKPDLGLLEWMPAMEIGRCVAIKTVGYHPTNPVQRGLPSVLATTTLFDTGSGRMLALTEATVLTALRTGAASAVATDVLARPGPVALGVIGCGAQAVSQIHAISRVRPIERLVVFDSEPTTAASLPARLAAIDCVPDIEVLDTAEDVVGSVDVLCTCTSVDPDAGPVFVDGDHRPWLHVNAVGADFAGKVELPIGLLRRALVCPDVVSQCVVEGECQQLAHDDIGPDLATLVRERSRWESARAEPSVFDSTGWSLEDLVTLELVVAHAERLGIGRHVDLQAAGDDPYDPYAVLRR